MVRGNTWARWHVVIAGLLIVTGACSHRAPDPPNVAAPPASTRQRPVNSKQTRRKDRAVTGATAAQTSKSTASVSASSPASSTAPVAKGSRPAASAPTPRNVPLPIVPAAQLAGTGIRRLDSRHLVLYTDLTPSAEVDRLPTIFDLAVPQWCAYFNVDPKRVAAWRMVGYLMKDAARFRRAGMLPEHVPAFHHGYQLGTQMWMYDQPSDYYCRHMLLHEGTHAFMNWHVGGCGPPWYAEGMAELLGTHLWHAGKLQLAYFPRHREEVPEWGRIKIVRDDVAAGRAKTIPQILAYGPHAHLQTDPYGWCWALCALLDGNPQFRTRFRQLYAHVKLDTKTFAETFDRLFATDRQHLDQQWQLFEYRIDYGYDLRREAVVYAQPHELPNTGVGDLLIQAARGWQSTGFVLRVGETYVLEAKGRYQIAKTSKIWWCEPDGVTIRYYGGQPLGRLLAAIVPIDWTATEPCRLLQPIPVGTRHELHCGHSGVLFLRVNDAPSELADNAGELRVTVRHD